MLYSYFDSDLIPFFYAKVLNSIPSNAHELQQFQSLNSKSKLFQIFIFIFLFFFIFFFIFLILTNGIQVNHVVKKKKKNHWGQAFFYPLETKSVIEHPSTKGSFH